MLTDRQLTLTHLPFDQSPHLLRVHFVLVLLAPDISQSLLELIQNGCFLSTGPLSRFVKLILDVLGILRCRLQLSLEAIRL